MGVPHADLSPKGIRGEVFKLGVLLSRESDDDKVASCS